MRGTNSPVDLARPKIGVETVERQRKGTDAIYISLQLDY